VTSETPTAHRVDAAMNSVQAPCIGAVLHGVLAHAEIHELAIGDDAVLTIRYPGNLSVKRNLSAYIAVKFHRVPAWQVNADGT